MTDTNRNIGPIIEQIAEHSIWQLIEKPMWDKIFLPLILLAKLDSQLAEEYNKAEGVPHKTRIANMVEGLKAKPYQNSFVEDYHFTKTTPLSYILATSSKKPVKEAMLAYIGGFPKETQSVFVRLELTPNPKTEGTLNWLDALSKERKKEILEPLLQGILEKIPFATMTGAEMGMAFEDCIRLFNEAKKKDAGEHYTPRDAVRLLTRLLVNGDIPKDGDIVDFYDPTCGTGGILMEGEAEIIKLCEESKRRDVKIKLYGQEQNPFTHAICQADLMLRGEDFRNIAEGNTLQVDLQKGTKFRYQGANPPYGLPWKKEQKEVEEEIAKKENGRFPAGAPKSTSEAQLLFLQHMVSKMKNPEDGGGRIAIVLNGNPLFAGDAGQGDSDIRGYFLNHDLIETIVALPKDMFFNTGIATYIWVLSNKKKAKREGNVQLIDATGMGQKLPKSLGNKRFELSDETIKQIQIWHRDVADETVDPRCKVLPREFFGYHSVDIEEAPEKGAKKGVRDTERIPLLDCPKGDQEKLHEIITGMRPSDAPNFKIVNVTIGWEIPFTQIFYKYEAPEDPLALAQKVQAAFGNLKLDLSFLT